MGKAVAAPHHLWRARLGWRREDCAVWRAKFGWLSFFLSSECTCTCKAVDFCGHFVHELQVLTPMARVQFAVALALVSACAGRTAVRQDSADLHRLISADRASQRPLSRLLSLRGGSAPFSAALFDFDGTLVDSEDVHRRSFSEVLGVTLDEDYWNAQCVGHSPRDIMTRHLPEGRLKPGESVDTLLRQRGELFEEHIAAGRLEQIEGAAELVTSLVAAGVRCAVVSSGNRGYIEKALEALNLTASFEFILAGDDAECTQHKPHPFPYLLAAGQLGLPPAQCLAFEDSLSGIRSAQAAGMHVVGVKNAMNTQLAADPAVIGTPPAALGADEPLLPLVGLVGSFYELEGIFN